MVRSHCARGRRALARALRVGITASRVCISTLHAHKTLSRRRCRWASNGCAYEWRLRPETDRVVQQWTDARRITHGPCPARGFPMSRTAAGCAHGQRTHHPQAWQLKSTTDTNTHHGHNINNQARIARMWHHTDLFTQCSVRMQSVSTSA